MNRTNILRARTGQNAVNNRNAAPYRVAPFLATVEETHHDRLTCDVVGGPRAVGDTSVGFRMRNIPVVTSVGINESDEIHGTNDLPEIGDLVVVMPIGGSGQTKVIIGSIAPYLYSKFQGEQTPVNLSDKQFSQKLLEPLKKLYRKIFRSGTSVEVLEDGTIQVETPSGTYAQVNEDSGVVKLEDQHGNIVTIDSDGVSLTDTNDNTVTIDSNGISLSDANGNTVEMGSSSVKINGTNLEVLQ